MLLTEEKVIAQNFSFVYVPKEKKRQIKTPLFSPSMAVKVAFYFFSQVIMPVVLIMEAAALFVWPFLEAEFVPVLIISFWRKTVQPA